MPSKFMEIVPQSRRQGAVSLLPPSDGPNLEIGSRLERHLPRFPAIQTHSSCRFHLAVDFPGLPVYDFISAIDYLNAGTDQRGYTGTY